MTIQNIGTQPGRSPINWCPPGSTKCFSFIKDYVYVAPLPECARGNPPCPIQPQPPFVFKAGDMIEGVMDIGILKTIDGREIPAIALKPAPQTYGSYAPQVIYLQSEGGGQGQKGAGNVEAKDPWTGKTEWDKVFSVQNFWRLVIVVFFIYLFLKYVLPLIKSSLKKS